MGNLAAMAEKISVRQTLHRNTEQENTDCDWVGRIEEGSGQIGIVDCKKLLLNHLLSLKDWYIHCPATRDAHVRTGSEVKRMTDIGVKLSTIGRSEGGGLLCLSEERI